ncbi:ABC-2 type transport system permease protein [Chitinophaga dinghuensis]|uniref:ABC-2 type transport system permease protein n=1 Tax=Chitinophaga dinghuensis TaxID=1539050 RepID=A0A327VWA1_9BACT|nr:ABC transporter permease [Chitinophaga dinghuensis]RAJ79186.1 ABC-2 type transport system permease protein [Chitinophaga dinghuensis]
MPNVFSHIGQLFLRELKLVAKDHSLLLTLLLAPLIYAFFYGSIYMYKVEEKVMLGVVDEDNSNLSRTFVEQVSKLQVAQVVRAASMEDAQQSMYYGQMQGFLLIPKGMEKKLLDLKQADVVLAVNGARFLPSSELAMAITNIGMTVGAGVRLRYNQMKGNTTTIAMQETMPVNFDYRPLYNTRSSYGGFLLPGLLALILQQTLLIGLAESVALDRQNKQIPQLVGMAGNSLSTTLWGKGLFYFLLFCAYAAFFMTVNYRTLDIPFRGHPLDVAVAFIIFIFTLIPLGFTLGTLFKGQLLTAQLMVFSTYPFFLLSGLAWPYDSLPRSMQLFSSLLPTTPFMKIYVAIVQTGASLADNMTSVIHLLLLWIMYVSLALWRLSILNRRR